MTFSVNVKIWVVEKTLKTGMNTFTGSVERTSEIDFLQPYEIRGRQCAFKQF